ncbi:MAG: hypothetical protein ACNI3C_12460 [Candidatus Marinarcus sp.]|uniref:hypothetical protein n=1 Tax=Candidatus Marinarcus sp. TaxID=3100987 RepID=UPI003AFFBB52
MSTITEDYYLCEGIYLKAKELIDDENPDKPLYITNINDKITIFEKEVKEWIIHPMWTLLRDDLIIDENNKSLDFKYKPFKNAIFVLFGIFSYLEKMERYRERIKKSEKIDESTEILCKGIERVFSSLKGINIRDIIRETRNQMMHTGMIGDGVLLNYTYEKEIEYIPQTKEIKINPFKILKTIEKDFNDYIQELKNKNISLVENFKKVFNSYYNDEINHLKP